MNSRCKRKERQLSAQKLLYKRIGNKSDNRRISAQIQTNFILDIDKPVNQNSEDPGAMPHTAEFHQDLHFW